MITGQSVLELVMPHRLSLTRISEIADSLPMLMQDKCDMARTLVAAAQESSMLIDRMIRGESWEEARAYRLCPSAFAPAQTEKAGG